jgi:site-specific recombinase XerD
MSELKDQFTFDELEKYLGYMQAIQQRSKLTIKEYKYDLVMFFRYYKMKHQLVSQSLSLKEISIDDIDEKLLRSVDINDFYAFITYISTVKNASPATRARKIASIRSFFHYLKIKRRMIDEDPSLELESPKQGKRLPRYLTLEESKRLLGAAALNDDKPFSNRDYCMLTLFLNCGMRLSELVMIDVQDINEDTIKVTGKGAKERTIYLNSACIEAISLWSEERSKNPASKKTNALFLSRLGTRISTKQVQVIVKKYLLSAGLDAKRYSTHKLRHTAATLMYKYGKVDIRALQQILGHESISTTEIYTHVDSDQLHHAVDSNPLAHVKK